MGKDCRCWSDFDPSTTIKTRLLNSSNSWEGINIWRVFLILALVPCSRLCMSLTPRFVHLARGVSRK
jgi:hypothetical protein